eukprot:7346070-Pyramimonas_sp.AAC.1
MCPDFVQHWGVPSCLGAAVCALMAVVSAWTLLRLPDVRGPWSRCKAIVGALPGVQTVARAERYAGRIATCLSAQ